MPVPVTVPTQPDQPWYRTLLRFIGPGTMIAVGYMDPGNWATDLTGGSKYYYNLLFAILFSNIVAMLLQSLAVKLGLVTGRDLAQLCRDQFHPVVSAFLYVTAECAIIATDLAEVIGAAIAMNLLFKLPLAWGVAITALDVLIILLGFGPKYLRWFEYGIMALIGTIGVLFIALLAKVDPIWGDVFLGYIPRKEIFADGGQLFIFMGIVGATVMPHNLYLHTHLIQYRYSSLMPPSLQPVGTIQPVPETEVKSTEPIMRHHKKLLPMTLKYTVIDCLLSLAFALFVNSAILIVAAASFYRTGNTEVASIEDAYNLLGTLLSPAFSVIFGVALLCSGQSSTITGTIAGQVVMSGFLGPRFKLKPWQRRLVSRSLAIIPAMIVALVKGGEGLNELLVISQVVLSCQLPFAMWPLVYFTSKKSECRPPSRRSLQLRTVSTRNLFGL
ncbi:NRAMP family [Powellomyces hirtus]|nr:NRAMP family [Powellomyces hirtus]